MGRKPSQNGHHRVFSPSHWSYYTVEKGPYPQIKRAIMFYADVLGILGITSTMIGKIDTLPEILVFIVCFIWLSARSVMYCFKVYAYIVDTQRRLKRERTER